MQDYLILGSGISGLAIGALLAKGGATVTILEASSLGPGGYAQNFGAGGFRFNASPRYLWDFGDGAIGSRFLQKLGLEKTVPFLELDRNGFDHVYVGDAERICVPRGWMRYRDVLMDRFPAAKESLQRFFAVVGRLYEMIRYIQDEDLYYRIFRPTVLAHVLSTKRSAWKAAEFARYSFRTLKDLFDEVCMPDMLRAVLYAHQLVLAESARDVALLAYVGATLNCHRGVYYPRFHMTSFVDEMAASVVRNGGEILLGKNVEQVIVGCGGLVKCVRTTDGHEYAARTVISNIDPATTYGMINVGRAAKAYRLPKYEYGNSLTSFYVGTTGLDVTGSKLARANIWYAESTLVDDEMYLADADLSARPRHLYLSAPTVFSTQPGIAPPEGHVITGFIPSTYRQFAKLSERGEQQNREMFEIFEEKILELLEARFIPGLNNHVACFAVRTPVDNRAMVGAPKGNVYARRFTPKGLFVERMRFNSKLPNLYFCSAYISLAGVASCIRGACYLYHCLTAEKM